MKKLITIIIVIIGLVVSLGLLLYAADNGKYLVGLIAICLGFIMSQLLANLIYNERENEKKKKVNNTKTSLNIS